MSAKGNEAVVRLLLETGTDVNAQGGHYGNAYVRPGQKRVGIGQGLSITREMSVRIRYIVGLPNFTYVKWDVYRETVSRFITDIFSQIS